MNVKKYNISKAGRKYQDNQGNEKTIWNNIGTMTEFYKPDGTVSRIMEIPAIGLEANVFPIVPKKQAPQGNSFEDYQPQKQDVVYPDDIQPSDIPF